MTETRKEEYMAQAQTPVPTVGDARRALALQGPREKFRTITVTFDSDDAYHTFGNLARDGGIAYAVSQATGAVYKMEE